MDTYWTETLFIAFTFYFLYSVSHFTYASMIWRFWLFFLLNHWSWIWPFTFYIQFVTSHTHQWYEHINYFSTEPIIISFTFYLLHPVSHFTYVSMIYTYGPCRIEPILTALTFYILHSISQITSMRLKFV